MARLFLSFQRFVFVFTHQVKKRQIIQKIVLLPPTRQPIAIRTLPFLYLLEVLYQFLFYQLESCIFFNQLEVYQFFASWNFSISTRTLQILLEHYKFY